MGASSALGGGAPSIEEERQHSKVTVQDSVGTAHAASGNVPMGMAGGGMQVGAASSPAGSAGGSTSSTPVVAVGGASSTGVQRPSAVIASNAPTPTTTGPTGVAPGSPYATNMFSTRSSGGTWTNAAIPISRQPNPGVQGSFLPRQPQ